MELPIFQSLGVSSLQMKLLLALQMSRLSNFRFKQASSFVHPVKAGLAFVLLFLSAELGPVPVGRRETEEYPGSQICASSLCFCPQRSELLQWSWNCSPRLFFSSSWVGFHTIKSQLQRQHVAGCSSLMTAQLPGALAFLPTVVKVGLQL